MPREMTPSTPHIISAIISFVASHGGYTRPMRCDRRGGVFVEGCLAANGVARRGSLDVTEILDVV